MSISSHLSPDPERRLWRILESLRRAIELSDMKIGALTALAAAEAAFLKLPAAGPLARLALLPLYAALPLGVFAFSPLPGALRWLPLLDMPPGKPGTDDSTISPDELAGSTRHELIIRLDRYLGGGISSTQYYEDLIGQIAVAGRVAARKERLLRLVCVAVGVGQLGLLLEAACR